MEYKREKLLSSLKSRLTHEPNLVQVIMGPRQVGKTTAIQSFLKKWSDFPSLYESADQLTPPDVNWIHELWERARAIAQKEKGCFLVIDEIQKILRWSEAIKKFFDEDRRFKTNVRVVLLGSSALMVQRGLTESLAGRFELIRFSHWSYAECKQAFGWDLEKYIFFGGYPGGANLLDNNLANLDRWQQYIRESLIETVLNKDILLLTPVDKPALFRQAFQLACAHPAEIVAYAKMVGQLHDAGNTTTIASYLHLLAAAQLVVPLPKYSGEKIRQRASSPKLLVLNNALINAAMLRDFSHTREDQKLWGRLVENCVGAHLFNQSLGTGAELFYWREGDLEVDYVLKKGSDLVAFEVKANGDKDQRGLDHFLKRYPQARPLRVGGKGADMDLETFLSWKNLP
ncbi:MAG: ATP-binding protein [Deltaproteobacteria bacterium]|nr:ATP-binding protein [Deltaproteobacteria bacterium]